MKDDNPRDLLQGLTDGLLARSSNRPRPYVLRRRLDLHLRREDVHCATEYRMLPLPVRSELPVRRDPLLLAFPVPIGPTTGFPTNRAAGLSPFERR
jgi:hypothetical protein